jgi:hypothetical protein
LTSLSGSIFNNFNTNQLIFNSISSKVFYNTNNLLSISSTLNYYGNYITTLSGSVNYINSQINNINSTLTGVTYDSYYNYQNFLNNVHIYGSLKTSSIADVDGTLNTINNTIQQISYSTDYGGYTQITNLFSPVINCYDYQLYGSSLPNLGNLQYLDVTTSLNGLTIGLQNQINSFSTVSGNFNYLQNQINLTNNIDTYQSLFLVSLSGNYNNLQSQINLNNNIDAYQSLYLTSTVCAKSLCE